MHPKLLDEIVSLCKRRHAQGDHPTESAASAETLENAVLQLDIIASQATELAALGENAARSAIRADALLALRLFLRGARLNYRTPDALKIIDDGIEAVNALRADASDQNRIIYLALMIATFSKHNAGRAAGECRDAAIELFGKEAVDAAMAVYKEQT